NGSYGQITSGTTGSSTSSAYYYFFNWSISEDAVACESPRKEVEISVSPDGDEKITSLPYTHSENTAHYGNYYIGEPGVDCGTEENYFNGNDVVYTYEATQDTVINVDLTDLKDFYAGVFIYDDCSAIGNQCQASATEGPGTDDLQIKSFEVSAGTNYYIVISSWLTEDIDYTLNIDYFSCLDLDKPVGN